MRPNSATLLIPLVVSAVWWAIVSTGVVDFPSVGSLGLLLPTFLSAGFIISLLSDDWGIALVAAFWFLPTLYGVDSFVTSSFSLVLSLALGSAIRYRDRRRRLPSFRNGMIPLVAYGLVATLFFYLATRAFPIQTYDVTADALAFVSALTGLAIVGILRWVSRKDVRRRGVSPVLGVFLLLVVYVTLSRLTQSGFSSDVVSLAVSASLTGIFFASLFRRTFKGSA